MRLPRTRVSLAVLFAVSTAMRLVALDRYPEWHSDEGFWANGARNHVLFGDAFLDNRLHPYLSPATYAALVGHFQIAEPSLATARIFSAICGVLTCFVVLAMARRMFPARPLLPSFLFGLSTFPVIVQRRMLLEAHQMLWLTVAAALLLSRLRRAHFLAGAAYGVAFLVKSNSIYVAPAFAIALLPFAADAASAWGGPRPDARDVEREPSPDEAPPKADPAKGSLRSRLSALGPLAAFFATTALVAGLGYGLIRLQDPQRFAAAFTYELVPNHFMGQIQDPLFFHVGRFGLRPVKAASVLWAFFRSEPFLVILAAIATFRVLLRPREAGREDRLFVTWLLVGIAFDLVQINVTIRYLGTLAPALILLGARPLDRMLSAPAEPRAVARRGLVVAALLSVFAIYHVGRLASGIRHSPNRAYFQTVRWIRDNVPRDTGVLAASYLSLSLPQRSYDFYRALHPYGDEDHTLDPAEVVREKHITIVVRDAEWREYETPETARFVAEGCTKLTEIDDYEVFRVNPPKGDAP